MTDSFSKHPKTESIHKIVWPHTMHMDLGLDWNYTKHGTDWNFTDCNVTTYAESPINITLMNVTDDKGKVLGGYYDFVDQGFGVLPNFKK